MIQGGTTSMEKKLKSMTYTSLFIALVFICTIAIAIPSPLGGYINLGDAAIYVASYILGPLLGFAAGGLGSMLGDFYLSFVQYMIPTLIIKGSMGAISGYFFIRERYLLGFLLGLSIMTLGYYGYEVLLYSNPISPLSNIPYNLIQGSLGSVVGFSLIKLVKKSGLPIGVN